ncbi:MAG TPA: ABC transporter ATP-binding protein [Myxococcales bacterium]|jgi:lipoprotein-releasing system ATP-binding protein
MEKPFCEIAGLHKSYFMDGKRIDVLRGVDMTLREGELVSLTGASGVGKSTFLHVLGTLDAPTEGSIRFGGRDVTSMDEGELARFRNASLGFVFQFHYLLPEFSALENVMMPALIQRLSYPEAKARAALLLADVGLKDRSHHKPGELSGGEQQRVALARALVMKPRLLLADEPTGNLDPATGEGIHQVLLEINRKQGIAAVVVTHNEKLAHSMPRRLQLSDGKVVELPPAPAP